MIDTQTAKRFAMYMKKYLYLYDELAEIVKQHVSSDKPVLVDLGCGPGLLLLALHKNFPQAQLYGIDPNGEMNVLAKNNIKESNVGNCTIVEGFSDNIPLNDGIADVVVSRFSLSYWKNPEKSFSEVHRLLKPGGKVVIEAINKDFPSWKLFFIKLHMFSNRAGGDVTKYHTDVYKQAYTQSQVEEFLQKAGFGIVKKEGKRKDWKFLFIVNK